MRSTEAACGLGRRAPSTRVRTRAPPLWWASGRASETCRSYTRRRSRRPGRCSPKCRSVYKTRLRGPNNVVLYTKRRSDRRALLQGALHQGDVHPAVELIRGVPQGANRLEARAGVQLQPRAVVRRDGGHDRLVAQALGLLDQLCQQRPAYAAPVVDRIHVHEVLDHVDATLLPRKESRPTDDATLIRGD